MLGCLKIIRWMVGWHPATLAGRAGQLRRICANFNNQEVKKLFNDKLYNLVSFGGGIRG